MAQHLGFDWDPEEVTGVEHPAPLDPDPIVNQGMLLASVARLQKQVQEGFGHVRALDSRLKRIERLLYGAVGSVLIAAAQYIHALLSHGP